MLGPTHYSLPGLYWLVRSQLNIQHFYGKKKPPEATEAYNENQLCGLFVFFEKKSDKYFRVFDIRCFYTFKLVNSRTRCYRVIVLLEFQVQGIISAIHTTRIYLSPFTKDIRVWVALQEITTICL